MSEERKYEVVDGDGAPEFDRAEVEETRELEDSIKRHPAHGGIQPLRAVATENNPSAGTNREKTVADFSPFMIKLGHYLDDARAKHEQTLWDRLLSRLSSGNISKRQQESEREIGRQIIEGSPPATQDILTYEGNHQWLWERHRRDLKPIHSTYEVRSGTILRSQDGSEPIQISVGEAQSLAIYAERYAKAVAEQIYNTKI